MIRPRRSVVTDSSRTQAHRPWGPDNARPSVALEPCRQDRARVPCTAVRRGIFVTFMLVAGPRCRAAGGLDGATEGSSTSPDPGTTPTDATASAPTGTSATDGDFPCDTVGDCTTAESPCRQAIACTAGQCVFDVVPEGTALPQQVAGDC